MLAPRMRAVATLAIVSCFLLGSVQAKGGGGSRGSRGSSSSRSYGSSASGCRSCYYSRSSGGYYTRSYVFVYYGSSHRCYSCGSSTRYNTNPDTMEMLVDAVKGNARVRFAPGSYPKASTVAGAESVCAKQGGTCSCPGGTVKYVSIASGATVTGYKSVIGDSIGCNNGVFGAITQDGTNQCICKKAHESNPQAYIDFTTQLCTRIADEMSGGLVVAGDCFADINVDSTAVNSTQGVDADVTVTMMLFKEGVTGGQVVSNLRTACSAYANKPITWPDIEKSCTDYYGTQQCTSQDVTRSATLLYSGSGDCLTDMNITQITLTSKLGAEYDEGDGGGVAVVFVLLMFVIAIVFMCVCCLKAKQHQQQQQHMQMVGAAADANHFNPQQMQPVCAQAVVLNPAPQVVVAHAVVVPGAKQP